MGNLAQEALGCCDDLVTALATVEAEVLKMCGETAQEALKLEFFNLRIRVGQIRARVPSAIVCAAVKELPTLAEVQQQRLKASASDRKMAAANDDSLLPL